MSMMEVTLEKGPKSYTLRTRYIHTSWEMIAEWKNARHHLPRQRVAEFSGPPEEEMFKRVHLKLAEGFRIATNNHPWLGEMNPVYDAVHTATIRCDDAPTRDLLVGCLMRANDTASSGFRVELVKDRRSVAYHRVETQSGAFQIDKDCSGYACITHGSLMSQCLGLISQLPGVSVTVQHSVCNIDPAVFFDDGSAKSYTELAHLRDAVHEAIQTSKPTSNANHAVSVINYAPIVGLDGVRLIPAIF